MNDQPTYDASRPAPEPQPLQTRAADASTTARPAMSHSADLEPTTLRCRNCGYNLTGVMIGGKCPECGARVVPVLAVTSTHPAAIACLIVGLLAIPGCMCYGIPSVVLGMACIPLFYLVAKDHASGKYSDNSIIMARAGVITGGLIALISLGFLSFFITTMIMMNP